MIYFTESKTQLTSRFLSAFCIRNRVFLKENSIWKRIAFSWSWHVLKRRAVWWRRCNSKKKRARRQNRFDSPSLSHTHTYTRLSLLHLSVMVDRPSLKIVLVGSEASKKTCVCSLAFSVGSELLRMQHFTATSTASFPFIKNSHTFSCFNWLNFFCFVSQVCLAFTTNTYPGDQLPETFDNFEVMFSFDNHDVVLT
jgi:hypothetical protein